MVYQEALCKLQQAICVNGGAKKNWYLRKMQHRSQTQMYDRQISEILIVILAFF